MVVIPADVKLGPDSSTSSAGTIQISPIQLPNPQIQQQIVPLFIMFEGGVPKIPVEITRFSHPFGSWLLVPEDTNLVPHISRNGNMTFVTKVDPLFPVLNVMDFSRDSVAKGVFQPLEAMCQTPDGTNLASLCEPNQIAHICDVKEVADDKYYRLSDEKVTKWLGKKHENLTQHEDVNSQNAFEILSQYITEKWVQLLQKSLGSGIERDGSDTTVPQTGADLAMAIMMEDAKETNRTKRLLQQTNSSKFSSAKKTRTSSLKKTRGQTKAASSFWSSAKSR